MKRGSTRGKRTDTKVSDFQSEQDEFADELRSKLQAVVAAQNALYTAARELRVFKPEESWNRKIVAEVSAIVDVYMRDISGWITSVEAVLATHGYTDERPAFINKHA